MTEWPKISSTTTRSRTVDWDHKRRRKRIITTTTDKLLQRKRKRRSLSETWTNPMSSTVILGSCQAMTGPLTLTLGKWMARKSRNRSLGNSYAIEGRIGEGAESGMDRSPATVRIMIVSSRCSHRVWWVLLQAIVSDLDLREAASRERRTIFQRMVDRLKVVEGSLNSSLIFSTKSLTETRRVALRRKQMSLNKRNRINLCFQVRRKKSQSSRMLLLCSLIRLEYSTNSSNSTTCLNLTKQTNSKWLWASSWTLKSVSLQWTPTSCNSSNRRHLWTSKWSWRTQQLFSSKWTKCRCKAITITNSRCSSSSNNSRKRAISMRIIQDLTWIKIDVIIIILKYYF